MIWFVALFIPFEGVPLFAWADGRRLGALSRPWVSGRAARHD